MTVTDITKTKKGRYALFVDGEFLFSIHKDSFFKTKLTTGISMTVQELEQLRLEDELLSAKEAALNVLSRAAQSSGMLREKLARYYGEEAVEGTVERMTELGLLDDVDYAKRLASDCVKLRGYSLARLRQELRRRKLPPEAIEAALEQFEERDESDPIIDIILKKYKAKIFDEEGLRKTIAALMRRGFSYSDIRTALNRIEEEELYLEQ
ncbi:MAG: regulatory protein RecX [Angelakisella sp.]